MVVIHPAPLQIPTPIQIIVPMPDRHRECQFAEILFQRLGLSPTNIRSGERPDLRFDIDSKRIGMEITECTPEEYYRGSKNKILSNGPVVFSISHLGDPEIKRDTAVLVEAMINRPEYVNMDFARREWCDRLCRRIEGKRKKLPAFEQFEENWLLVWDNNGLSDGASTLDGIQSDMLSTPFTASDGEADFDHIYVISGNYTFDIVPGKIGFFHEQPKEINTWLADFPSAEQA